MWRPDGTMHATAWWSTWQGGLLIGLMIVIAGSLLWLAIRPPARPETSTTAAGRDDEAVALARMRYARGELDRETFTQVTLDLAGEATADRAGLTVVTDPSGPATPDPGTPPPTPA